MPEQACNKFVPNDGSVIESGDLNLANGLLVFLDMALSAVEPGETVRISSLDPSGKEDMMVWARRAGHGLEFRYIDDSILYEITKGNIRDYLISEKPDWGLRAELTEGGEFPTGNWMIGRMGRIDEHASSHRGFSPRGALIEEHSPGCDFTISKMREVWAREISDLYDQAVSSQWSAKSDIAWDTIPALPEDIERAVCRLMTFLIENEYSALYVPGKFLSRIHPEYLEVVMFLTTQLMDESRHIEAFTKRALVNGGGLQICAASTEYSLKSLFDQHDFSSASFLLSVLGEGTFLDLLRFIEEHAPEPVTADLMGKARRDEARHVHFGTAHIRYLLESEPASAERLIAAVTERASRIGDSTSMSKHVIESLAILAGGGSDWRSLKLGMEHVSRLLQEMDANRKKRLVSVGFSEDQAELISSLHTPNFM